MYPQFVQSVLVAVATLYQPLITRVRSLPLSTSSTRTHTHTHTHKHIIVIIIIIIIIITTTTTTTTTTHTTTTTTTTTIFSFRLTGLFSGNHSSLAQERVKLIRLLSATITNRCSASYLNGQIMQRCSDSLKRCKVSLQVGVAFEDGVRESMCFVGLAVLCFTQKQVFGPRTAKSQPIWIKFCTHCTEYTYGPI